MTPLGEDALLSRVVYTQIVDALEAAGIPPRGNKSAMLAALARGAGTAAVFRAGARSSGWRDSPVIDALMRAGDPGDLLQRWQRLERFGHRHNRTRAIDVSANSVSVEHIATDGAPIAPMDSVFTWGMLAGLFTRWGVHGLSVRIDVDVDLMEGDRIVEPRSAAPKSDTAHFRWTSMRSPTHAPLPSDHEACGLGARETMGQITSLLRTDLGRRWEVSQVARQLHLSRRSLQRRLQEEHTSFSEVLLRTRVAGAVDLLVQGARSISEAAFAAGFSDAAHFARSSRRFYDVPPTALVEVLEPPADR